MTTHESRFVKRTLRRWIGLGLTLCSLPAATIAQIELNKLNACQEMEAVVRQLWAPKPTHCRAVRGAIERQIAATPGLLDERACLLQELPRSSLAGFSCLRTDVPDGAAFTCYRPVAASLLEDYKTRFVDHYARPVSRYFEEAKRCAVSPGGATQSPQTMIPPMLMHVGQFEFGYIAKLGGPLPGGAVAVHGFASAAPSLARAGVEAVEFLSYYRSPGVASVRARTTIGHWRVAVDNASALESEFRRQARRAGALVSLAGLDIDVHRTFEAPKYSGSSITAALSRVAIDGFIGEGFEQASEDDIRRVTGMSSQEMVAEIGKRAPFGHRGTIERIAASTRIAALAKDRGVPCTRDDGGAFGAYVLHTGGEPGVQVDHGSVTVLVLGLGACARRSEALRRYTTSLIDEAKQAMLEQLERR